MNFLPYATRFKNVFSGPTLKSVPTLLIATSRKTTFSSLCSSVKVDQNQVGLLQLSKPSSNLRLYMGSAATVPRKEIHAPIWVAERIVSIGLLASIPLVLGDSAWEDAEMIVDILIALHVHWGLEAIFKDYLRPSVVGNVIPKYCEVYAGIVSIYLAVALLWISMYGIGVGKTVKHLWCLDPNIRN